MINTPTIKKILENDWYKTASTQEMRVALMHVEMNAMDSLSNHLNETYQQKRRDCLESCSEDNGWNKGK